MNCKPFIAVYLRKEDPCNLTFNFFTISKLTGFVFDMALLNEIENKD